MSVQVKGSGTIGGIDEGLNITGIVTATSFVGSGANLTNLPSQVTITGNADNRVITGGSGTNLNGEANLTFDGKTLTTKTTSYPETTEFTTEFKAGVANGNRFKNRYIKLTNTYTGSAHGGLPIIWETNADNSNNKGYGAVVTEYDGSIRFLNSGATSAKSVGTDLLSTVTERLRIKSGGTVQFNNSVGIQTTNIDSANLSNPVGAGHSLVGLYIGDGSLMFSSALSRTGGYYISTDVNALNAGPVTLNSNMKIDGTWTIV